MEERLTREIQEEMAVKSTSTKILDHHKERLDNYERLIFLMYSYLSTKTKEFCKFEKLLNVNNEMRKILKGCNIDTYVEYLKDIQNKMNEIKSLKEE